jgi:hypothetical protein
MKAAYDNLRSGAALNRRNGAEHSRHDRGRPCCRPHRAEARTRIHSYVTEHKIRPVETREKSLSARPFRGTSNSKRCRPNGGHR